MKTLIGIVTFGNLPFTKLAIRALRETVKGEFGIFVIVGKPDDMETADYLKEVGIGYIRHEQNMGFPFSINDLMDIAKMWACDNLIIMGNDVVPYPEAINRMIAVAEGTRYEWICAAQFDARSLVDRYPEVRKYFTGDNLMFTDFAARPWDIHWSVAQCEIASQDALVDDAITDVRNLCLFKRTVFDKIGYADVNFWPGGYFEDNDYFMRARRAGIIACTLRSALYFHFWSRTIHQQGGSTTPKYFERNRKYYELKWGGPVNHEQLTLPAGMPLNIQTREDEGRIIRHWRDQP